MVDLVSIENAELMVIDDEEMNLEILEEVFESDGFRHLHFFSNPQIAIDHYKNNPPDLVLLDLNMPYLSGFEVIEQFKTVSHSPPPPILMITARDDSETKLKALESGARDFISKPFDDQEVTRRARNLLEMHLIHKQNLCYSSDLEHIIQQRTHELQATQLEMIERLGLAAEYRDNETAAHTIRVGLYAKTIGTCLGLNEQTADQLRLSAPLHDIGKIGISDNILLKPGKLDEQEWEVMKKHAEFGYTILKDSKSTLLKNAGIIALTHHEKWDGSGYPAGLKGNDIHLYGRITAIADVFDALTMSRPYKKAWSTEEAADLINQQSGKHFDPSIVDAFNHVLTDLLNIRQTHAD